MSHLIFSQNSQKKRKFKTDFLPGKTLGEFFNEKWVSAHQKFSDFFKKMVSQNNDLRIKNLKNT